MENKMFNFLKKKFEKRKKENEFYIDTVSVGIDYDFLCWLVHKEKWNGLIQIAQEQEGGVYYEQCEIHPLAKVIMTNAAVTYGDRQRLYPYPKFTPTFSDIEISDLYTRHEIKNPLGIFQPKH